MGLYVIDINERTQNGRQLKHIITEKQASFKVYSLEEFEEIEELALMKIMNKSKDEVLISAKELEDNISSLKKRLAK